MTDFCSWDGALLFRGAAFLSRVHQLQARAPREAEALRSETSSLSVIRKIFRSTGAVSDDIFPSTHPVSGTEQRPEVSSSLPITAPTNCDHTRTPSITSKGTQEWISGREEHQGEELESVFVAE